MFHCKPPGLIGATRAGFRSVKSKARLSSANADAHTGLFSGIAYEF